MRLFDIDAYVQRKSPDQAGFYREDILTEKDCMKDLGGMFGLLAPGSQVPYHYHKNRDSILIAISGEAVEVVEGKETPFKAGQVIVIPPGEKHQIVNRSKREFRYLEFYTSPPAMADFVEVKEHETR